MTEPNEPGPAPAPEAEAPVADAQDGAPETEAPAGDGQDGATGGEPPAGVGEDSVPTTGHPGVDAALARLRGVPDTPVHEHAEQYAAVHEELVRVLAETESSAPVQGSQPSRD